MTRQPATAPPMSPNWLRAYGLVSERFGGVQIDISTVVRWVSGRAVQTYLCDHNCTTHVKGKPTGGEYNCPAAFTLTRGGVQQPVPRGADIVEGVRRTAAALVSERDRYLAEDLPQHCEQFAIPDALAATAAGMWAGDGVEVALFGGSPETHPDITHVISALAGAGHSVHVTMTGRRLLREPEFAERIANAGADVLAVSADDVDRPEELERLLALDLRELVAEWRSVPRLHGQLQKVYEAIYACRVLVPLGARLLVNIAVHDRNLGWFERFLDAWTAALPEVWLNPFPVQSGFDPDLAGDGVHRLDLMGSFVAAIVRRHHERATSARAGWRVAPRIHYWLMLQAAFDVYRGRTDRLATTVGGAAFWRCYASAGAGRYVQIAGGAGEPVAGGPAGGRPGCFWNATITAPTELRIWDATPRQLHTYLRRRPELAATNPSPCAGCGFPRLLGDSLSAEAGMGADLRERYLELRMQELGY